MLGLKNNINYTNKLNQKQLIGDLSRVLKDLIDIIARENILLEGGRISQLDAVVAEKFAALEKFNQAEINIEIYKKQGGSFDQRKPDIVQAMELFQKFDKHTRRNEVLIQSNIEVSAKIVEMYKESKKAQALRKFGYNKKGKIAVSKNVESIMPSIGLNDTI
ncbi:MAG: hypothetical protein COA94_05285 [Rickettsiales bacterium]|nr:MAG: hypothetical protein COA94_05285 [Rickettsiales bacterium]